MEEVKDVSISRDFSAEVEAKKGLVIGLGAGTALAGAIGFLMGSWTLAIIAGVVFAVAYWRKSAR